MKGNKMRYHSLRHYDRVQRLKARESTPTWVIWAILAIAFVTAYGIHYLTLAKW